jgi:hypothetical protein
MVLHLRVRRLRRNLALVLLSMSTAAVGEITKERAKSTNDDPWRHHDFVRRMQHLEQTQQIPSQHELVQEQLRRSARLLTPELAKELQLETKHDRGLYSSYYNNDYSSSEYQDYDTYDGGYSRTNDLTSYALKYIGCTNIHTWDDNRVAAGLTPMKIERFVVLRLCESDSCSAYNKYGCNAQYGEYVMPMEDYLSVMSTYHLQQFNRYCQTCSECMTFDLSTFLKATGPTPSPATSTDDTSYATNDDGSYGNDDNGRLLSYNYEGSSYGYNRNSYYQQKQLPWYVDEYGVCLFQKVCTGYKRACQNNYHPNATYYQDYFACTQFQLSSSGSIGGYLGPHCRNDGITIGIGIFSDTDCSTYVGDVDEFKQIQKDSSVSDDNELSLFYSTSCISCRASDGYSLIQDAYVNDNMYSTYPLCGAVYDFSAKCNLHMSANSRLVRAAVVFVWILSVVECVSACVCWRLHLVVGAIKTTIATR